MKTTLLAVLAAILGTGLAVHAQNMVEYSNLSSQSAAKSLAAPAATTPHGHAPRVIDSSPGGSKTVKVWQEKHGRVQEATAAKTDPPAVFVLSNGERVEATHYSVTVNSLRIEDEGKERTIPTSALNVNATLAANNERGVSVKIPTDKTEVMVSF